MCSKTSHWSKTCKAKDRRNLLHEHCVIIADGKEPLDPPLIQPSPPLVGAALGGPRLFVKNALFFRNPLAKLLILQESFVAAHVPSENRGEIMRIKNWVASTLLAATLAVEAPALLASPQAVRFEPAVARSDAQYVNVVQRRRARRRYSNGRYVTVRRRSKKKSAAIIGGSAAGGCRDWCTGRR